MKHLVVDLKEVADLIIAEVVIAKSNPDISPKEKRIGLLFGVGALIHSGRLSEAFTRPSTQAATIQFTMKLLNQMLRHDTLKQLQILELTIETALGLLAPVPKTLFQGQLHSVFTKILSSTADDLQPEYLSLALGIHKLFGHFIAVDNPQLWN